MGHKVTDPFGEDGWTAYIKLKNKNIGEKMENRNKKRTSKFLMILNIIMLLTLVAVPTYAFFWNKPVVNQDISVNIGVEEGLIIQEQKWVTNGLLIPQGTTATASNETDTLVYEVKLLRTGIVDSSYDVQLEVTQSNSSLFSITTNVDEHDTANYTVTITIKLVNNITQEQFNSLDKTQVLNFNFSLEYELVTP